VVAVLLGLAVLTAYLLPGLSHPGTRWPLWDARVYWWGGQQAARGAPLYAAGGPFNFTYPPFAASVFRLGAAAPEGWLAAVITAGSIIALVALCWQALGAAAVRRRPETVFAAAALALPREIPVARPGRTGPYLAGPALRRWPSLIGWTMAWSPEVRLPSPTTKRQP
jgi:hypothetical protein